MTATPLPALHADDLEHELKLVFPARRAGVLLARLAALTAPDPAFPDNVVASVYYDTVELDSLFEKLDSHRAKVKYRLRWYEDPRRGPGDDPSFFEVKYRFATQRVKRRVPVDLAASRVAAASLADAALAAVPRGLWAAGVAPPPGLSPCLTVRYRRRRFVDRRGGTRLSLDTGVHLGPVDPRRVPPGARPPLPVAVLEVKNRDGRVPPHLAGLLPAGWRRLSLSKYAACFLAATGHRRLLLDPP